MTATEWLAARVVTLPYDGVVPYSTCESTAIAVTQAIFAVFAMVVALTALIQVWVQDFPALDMKLREPRLRERSGWSRLGDQGQLIGTSNG